MTKLKGLLLTEGMHGMISQVEGLAKALQLDFIHEKIELNYFWKLIPPKITPIQSFVFKNSMDKKFHIVISCGRKSVIPSIYLKKKFKNKIMNIHIQDPKVSLDNFDYIVAPEHDGLKGKNVLNTKGAIQFLKIQNNFIKKGFQLILIPSMRTPKKIIDLAKNFFDENQVIILGVDKKAYLSSLKLADHIVVTCDSTSMISEAAMTGKPIYVAHMPPVRKNERFKKFFELFKSLKIIKDLENSLDEWNYKKLNETDKISRYIKDNFKNYDFS